MCIIKDLLSHFYDLLYINTILANITFLSYRTSSKQNVKSKQSLLHISQNHSLTTLRAGEYFSGSRPRPRLDLVVDQGHVELARRGGARQHPQQGVLRPAHVRQQGEFRSVGPIRAALLDLLDGRLVHEDRLELIDQDGRHEHTEESAFEQQNDAVHSGT